MSERTSTPVEQAPDITPAIEARVLTDLVKSFGIDICIAEETGEPFFGFSDESTMEAAVIASRITDRFRTEPIFKAAMYKVAEVRGNLIPPPASHVETEAEKFCGQLDECGFLVGIIYSGPAPAKPAVVFERYGPLASEVETLSLMDAIQGRFTNDGAFADDLLTHCTNMGAIYDERRPAG